ncbi:Phosphate acetyltransferase [Paraburkholderia phenoliruptrix]|uniref:Phosphate acetyltransferase n=1 Tax=Paraburkholderia phenoliruptrix TaxID=252970 RepID=A0A6J5BZ38_9BURK|nr:bifunctional enoyl-CoA hydratase/phosphate acetyltransferase [Paraburkholderia phenoliruptrix]CAB3722267.1 Phosphate acetyltransferase [Paraburkholderia phenoliruptrix]
MNACQETAEPAAHALPGLVQGPHGEPSALLRLALARGPVRTAVVHPCDSPSLAAMSAAFRGGLIDPVIVAPRDRLRPLASAAGIHLNGIEIVDVPHSHAAAARAVELAAHGEVQALMKGSLHTDELMAAVVPPESGLRTGKRISHCFLMQLPSYARPFIITDAAINVAPDLEQKCGIVQNAIDLGHALGLALPRVAILGAVETVNPHMRSTLDAAALSKMADRGQLIGALVDGPLAFDNAISVRAARLKGIASPVAGRADILVVPDVEAGNMLVKQLEFLSGAASAGIVMGARVPIVLTSRADSVSARIASCALAAVLAIRPVGSGHTKGNV